MTTSEMELSLCTQPAYVTRPRYSCACVAVINCSVGHLLEFIACGRYVALNSARIYAITIYNEGTKVQNPRRLCRIANIHIYTRQYIMHTRTNA